MADYYLYLWSTTWPNLIVLFLICGVVLFQIIWKFVDTWRYARDAWGFLLIIGQATMWVLVLGVYTKLLLFSQPDWFMEPGVTQGSVQEKVFDLGSNSYVIDIHSGSELEQFYIDDKVYEQLNIEDQVKLLYLPVRREVVRCELIESLQ